MMNEIIVAGAGSGSAMHITNEVIEAIKNSDLIFAASRLKNLIPTEKNFSEIKDFNEAFNKIENSNGRILILLSGDAGFYSLLPLIKKRFPEKKIKIKILPGISSLQIICAKAGEVWNDAKILSGHGRDLNMGFFLNIIEREKLTVLLCDKKNSPDFICENLIKIKNKIEVFIGENLGSELERISHGSPDEFLRQEFSELSIMLIKNHEIYKPEKIFLRDNDFLREKNIVMTNENVRAVIISKLNFCGDNLIFWDIGAGSGSVSICAAHENPFNLQVHSIEYKPEALNLISQNSEKFHLHNINIHAGRAINIIKNLPVPSHVFIGGSDGELREILGFLSSLKSPVKTVIASVTLETFSTAYEIMKDMCDFEATQIAVTSSKNLNQKLTLMHANNPVMILSALTK